MAVIHRPTLFAANPDLPADGFHPAVAAWFVADRRVQRAGAGGLAELVEPVPFLRELALRGVRAAVFEGSGRRVS